MRHENRNYEIEKEMRRLIEADERERQREIEADKKKLADRNGQELARN